MVLGLVMVAISIDFELLSSLLRLVFLSFLQYRYAYNVKERLKCNEDSLFSICSSLVEVALLQCMSWFINSKKSNFLQINFNKRLFKVSF